MKSIKGIGEFLLGFFPIQLVFLHLRRSFLLMSFWIFLSGLVGGWWFSEFGFLHLFCTPEYLENVSWIAYFLIGLTLGLFVMAFHISSYIFYSYRFSFLAAIRRPLFVFSINNSILPMAFYVFYAYNIYQLQIDNDSHPREIIGYIASVFMGSIVVISFVFFYFFSTIKTILPTAKKIAGKIERPLNALIKKEKKLNIDDRLIDINRVHSYLKNFYSIKATRSVQHYPESVLLQTLQQHHLSAALFFVVITGLLLSLSFFGEKELLMIPAGSSLVLLFTFAIMVIGAFYTRFKTWSFTIGLLLLLALNIISGWPFFEKKYAAFGLNYDEPPTPYSYAKFEEILTKSNIEQDTEQMLLALNNWRSKFPSTENPRLLLINSSGGGLRSAVWSFGIMQQLDQKTSGAFMEHVFGIFGSSGGMIGAAYMRELQLLKVLGADREMYHPKHLEYIGKDLLNPVAFYLTSNDLTLRLKKFSDEKYEYFQDRGFAFERQLNKNLNGAFTRRLAEYGPYEEKALIPHLFLTPTIIQDGRRLLISPNSVSFLMRPTTAPHLPNSYLIDGIDFMRFLAAHDAANLRFSTALRMSANFPYITPLISLPTSPPIDLIDAGARDNEGFELTIRFLHTFKDWISENTSGVTIIRLKANAVDEIQLDSLSNKTIFENLIRPIGGVVNSYSNFQHYTKAQYLGLSDDWLTFPLDFTTFSLLTLEDEVSLSWHLTEKEQNIIQREIQSQRIKDIVQELNEIHLPAKTRM